MPGFGYRTTLASALPAAGRAADAGRSFAAVLRLPVNDAGAHPNPGAAYAGTERWADARRQFETALSLKPEYPEARRNPARLRPLTGK